VYHLLSLLESDAAAAAAARATQAQIDELQALHKSLEAAVSQREKFFTINEQFHVRLLEIAGNRWQQQMVADLRKVMTLNRHNSLLKSGRIRESMTEHRAIMQAIARRDAAGALACMQKHFRNGLRAAA
jgi:DNA-binding GntR family transcriptional regulator